MTGRGRRTIALAVLALLGGWSAASAADRGAGTAYYSPGASSPGAGAYGAAAGPTGGNFRPTDSFGGQWSGQPGAGSTWSPAAGGSPSGGASAWDGSGYGFRGDAGSGQTGRPGGDYRFRPRPDDKATRTDDAPRYRPDPELARRSQQFWGVPGQDPSLYGGGPSPVFRPLQPEREQAGRPAASGPGYGESTPPAWPAYPVAPSAGYGYPY
jgi:hypothetical protein